jgi:lysozyme
VGPGAIGAFLYVLADAASAPAAPEACGAARRLAGVDVSHHQGAIDWKQVKAAGVVFAFARVADGTTVLDERFAENWKGMKRAGVRRGAYQVFRAEEDPEAQAELFIKLVHRLGRPDLPLVADVETDDGQTAERVRAGLGRWLRRVEKRTRRRPIIYTSPSMSELLGDGFGRFPLWVAHYEVECPTVPEGWRRWAFWQHSSKGTIPGISGPVDLDHFAGTLSQLRRLGRASVVVAAEQ